ncbi:MAG TPA: hypothetical protein PLE30_00835 [Candidatus Kapabacteria bacterium]|nr:hypothetical protein [Candidatus Kapabacteria bacterium]
MQFDKAYIHDLKQIKEMQKYFPQFKICGHGLNYSFVGNLKPSENSNLYKIKIEYKYYKNSRKKIPQVFILNPIIERPIHMYSDGSLCLYHPDNFQWSHSCSIAKIIVPWISTWLYFYEKWLTTKVWLGEEVPHKPKNK